MNLDIIRKSATRDISACNCGSSGGIYNPIYSSHDILRFIITTHEVGGASISV